MTCVSTSNCDLTERRVVGEADLHPWGSDLDHQWRLQSPVFHQVSCVPLAAVRTTPEGSLSLLSITGPSLSWARGYGNLIRVPQGQKETVCSPGGEMAKANQSPAAGLA